MLDFIFVGLGGFLGAVLRYVLTLIPTKNPQPFPSNYTFNKCVRFALHWAYSTVDEQKFKFGFTLDTVFKSRYMRRLHHFFDLFT